jgi:hypothetical protein
MGTVRLGGTIALTGEPKSTQHIYRSTCRGGLTRNETR